MHDIDHRKPHMVSLAQTRVWQPSDHLAERSRAHAGAKASTIPIVGTPAVTTDPVHTVDLY